MTKEQTEIVIAATVLLLGLYLLFPVFGFSGYVFWP